ncbi:glucose-6-phosphate exchanger SLC37A4 isoform X2 [Octopus bimaculoides]|uniref:glucose-6-phosphate exchanger SLC37A4 isoform X2 n=1 Tax=Octopus bimaculoides TaxID=37653 RepID=UPI00071C31AA|nr:glucose-6-phosphate exchanger SLC37A4 isoform X2 [Octopus bimaculoides]|eukprot:XP_014776199.1 PREDICTED: glucose-6-phosphate translocase-like isoform X2 [Octopus bimaculoides]
MANFRQLLQLASLFIGYGLSVFVRKSFTFVLPDVINSTGVERSQLGLVTSSQCIAYSVSKFIGGFLADQYRPKLLLQISLIGSALTAFAFTACSAMLLAAIFIVTLHEDPSKFGLENYLEEHSGDKNKSLNKKNETNISQVTSVFLDPFLFLLGISYLLLCGIRTCMMDWSHLYLIQEKQLSPILGSMVASSMEVGGIVGSIVSGIWSDKASTSPGSVSRVKCRLNVARNFSFGVTLSLYLFVHHIHYYSNEIFIVLVGFAIGFFVYGPLTISGVAALESVPGHMCGAASSVCSAFGNTGGVIAGLPVTYLASQRGWHQTFVYINYSSVIALALLWQLGRMQCQLKQQDNTRDKTS